MGLDVIGLRHGTDKASHGHDYLRIYEPLIPADVPVKLLEIGWYEGASMRTWREYLHPESIVVGVDINQPAEPVDRVHFRQANATKPTEIVAVAEEFGDFDVVVDDGSHLSPDVTETFRLLWSRVAPGGLYIIEDLHVSYHPDWLGWDPTSTKGRSRPIRGTSMEYLKNVADAVHFDHSGSGPAAPMMRDVASIAFHPGVAIVRKKVA